MGTHGALHALIVGPREARRANRSCVQVLLGLGLPREVIAAHGKVDLMGFSCVLGRGAHFKNVGLIVEYRLSIKVCRFADHADAFPASVVDFILVCTPDIESQIVRIQVLLSQHPTCLQLQIVVVDSEEALGGADNDEAVPRNDLHFVSN